MLSTLASTVVVGLHAAPVTEVLSHIIVGLYFPLLRTKMKIGKELNSLTIEVSILELKT